MTIEEVLVLARERRVLPPISRRSAMSAGDRMGFIAVSLTSIFRSRRSATKTELVLFVSQTQLRTPITQSRLRSKRWTPHRGELDRDLGKTSFDIILTESGVSSR